MYLVHKALEVSPDDYVIILKDKESRDFFLKYTAAKESIANYTLVLLNQPTNVRLLEY